jgi:hypothetical protein
MLSDILIAAVVRVYHMDNSVAAVLVELIVLGCSTLLTPNVCTTPNAAANNAVPSRSPARARACARTALTDGREIRYGTVVRIYLEQPHFVHHPLTQIQQRCHLCALRVHARAYIPDTGQP